MSHTKQILNSWKFKSSESQAWLPAQVPGCVHTDLLLNDKIPSPFYGENERDLQWIDKLDWEYETIFDLTDAVWNAPHVDVFFAGLDTYADVVLNGQHILSADNMFREWRRDVRDILVKHNNSLRIRFRSPIQEDSQKLEKLGYNLPAINDQSERGGVGENKLSVFARKAPYHYGWDWGPRFVTSGIWREACLEAWSASRITDLFIQQTIVTEEVAELTAILEIESDAEWSGNLKLSCEGLRICQNVDLQPGMNQLEVEFKIENPKLWWSRGLGEAHLYTFQTALEKDEVTISDRSVTTGLRRVRLVREDDEVGTSFYIELNGVPVFAKGANHIPNDSFLTEVTHERFKHEIVTAVESNMNMLRVWGGGVYENDEFYALCDAYGILVWQDFMFACSMYPGDEAFLNNVRIEAEENVKRLRNHPCIALWCGNNEIDTAWAQYKEDGGWGWKQQYEKPVRDKIWRDYEAIFHGILPKTIARLAPGTDYWASSPMQARTGDETQHSTHEATRGDMHYWGVWHAVEPFSNYNVHLGRFMSEYGFQSFPELKTVQSYTSEIDMQLESDVMRWHQRSGDGNRLIKEYMDIYCKVPKDFPSFLYMSQVLQAEAIRIAIEAHRRNKPYCMGTLYWQINDCWPVASWSSIDYFGRWKALQYYVKTSYKDIAVSFHEEQGTVSVYILSDLLTPVSGTLDLRMYDFTGVLLRQESQDVNLAANGVQVVYSVKTEDLLQSHRPSQVVLVATLQTSYGVIDCKKHYFVPMKQIELAQPNITIRQLESDQGTAFELETDVLAKQVYLSCQTEGVFTDNYFDLVPGISKTIGFLKREVGQDAFTPADAGEVMVKSMFDFILQ